MMKSPAFAAALAILLITSGVGLWIYYSDEPPTSGASSASVPVYFTCDARGRLEPCGCFTGQMGGMTRIQSWLQRYQAKDSLLVDVGNSLAGKEDFRVIKYEHILEAFDQMGYHALNLGAAESKIPGESLRKVISSSEAPLISASIIDLKTNELIAPPTRVVTIQGRKIGLLGVLDPNSVADPGEDLKIRSLDDAISRHLPDLTASCDEVILLAYANEDEMKRIAQEFFEISLIIGGDVKQSSQYLEKENESYLVFTTNQARTVGRVILSQNPKGGLLASDFDIFLMKPTFPQSQDLLAISDRYRKRIRETDLLVDHPERLNENDIPGVKPHATYVGSDSCLKCHAQEGEKWHASAHSKAFASLIEKNSDADPSCIKCHTVGFGTPSGYRRIFGKEKFTDVGCESCHGPGSEHVNAWNLGKKPAFKFRPLGAGDCMQCHYGEFSRPFDWDKFWPLIEHGKKK